MEADGNPKRPETKETEVLSYCPSFNSYSDLSAQIAEVSDERSRQETANGPEDNDNDEDFEFALVHGDHEITGDEISCGVSEFGPIFPVFNRDILFRGDQVREGDKPKFGRIRLPLEKLFQEDCGERGPPSSSSSEADELERLPEGTYCVWRPNSKALVRESPSRCNKSSSTGSASKRWKIRDLLRRSNSDGKNSFVFFTPKNRDEKEIENPKESPNSGRNSKAKGVAGGNVKASPTSAHERLYIRNRASKEVDKRKSYLPYRQDLVGFFAMGTGKPIPPF